MPTATAADLTVRELPPAEWEKLRRFDFFKEYLPPPEKWKIVVAERGEEIVAYCCLFYAMHCEPVWFDPSVQHHPKLFIGLWQQVRDVIEKAGEGSVLITVDPDQPESHDLWTRFGFTQVPAQLYLGDLRNLP